MKRALRVRVPLSGLHMDPGQPNPVSSPLGCQVLRLGADTHLLGRALRAAASPARSWPLDGAWWHQRQLLTHLGFASSAPTHSAAARPGLGLVRADPAPWQPQPIGVAGWGLHASRPSAVGGWAVCLPALAAAAAAGVPRNRCWIREVEKHRRAPQGKGIPRSVEAAKPTLGKFSKGCAEDSF